MNRRRIALGGLLLALAYFVWAPPSHALITSPTSLGDFISDTTFIFMAKVDAVDPDKPGMVLTFDENLKGKFPFKRLPVNLTGDSDAEKHKDRPVLLKRVAPKLPVVVFVTQRKGKESEFFGFVYTNGTWFQMTGEKPADAEVARWSFAHIEPYLRRTYKGTTAEMKQTLVDALSGKAKPPQMDAKEKPGVGPEVDEQPKEKKDSAACGLATGPVFAVIPAVMIGGPLALLALLFPSVFGGWKRWLSLISVACTTSSIYWLHWLFSDTHLKAWWSSVLAYWTLMTLVTLAGAFWAWQRHIQRLMHGEAPLRPGLIEMLVMAAVSLFALGTIGWYRWYHNPLLSADGLPVLAFAAGVWVGTVYTVVAGSRPARMPVIATEVVVLTTMALVSTGLLLALGGSGAARSPIVVEGGAAQPPKLVWTFEVPGRGAVESSPVVVGDRVYIAAAHDHAFEPYGALYCLDRKTGDMLWKFDNNEQMKQVFSTPMVVGDRVYIGEGFHQHSKCKIYCLKADTGEKVWDVETLSHTESSPFVADGRVYCGAGDDGLYCLDAQTKELKWKFPGYHFDAGPVVADGSVYCGAGVGDVFRETAFFCLDAKTGDVRWRFPTPQPVWNSAAVDGKFVYVGMGNGRLNEPDDHPKGAVVCLDADAKGEQVWRFERDSAVYCRPLIDAGYLYFGDQDGNFYCLNRRTGKEIWRTKLASPVSATAVLSSNKPGGPRSEIVVAAQAGQLYCLAADSGAVRWAMDVAADQSSAVPEVFSTPFVEESTDSKAKRRFYVGITLQANGRKGSLACYEEGAAKDKE